MKREKSNTHYYLPSGRNENKVTLFKKNVDSRNNNRNSLVKKKENIGIIDSGISNTSFSYKADNIDLFLMNLQKKKSKMPSQERNTICFKEESRRNNKHDTRFLTNAAEFKEVSPNKLFTNLYNKSPITFSRREKNFTKESPNKTFTNLEMKKLKPEDKSLRVLSATKYSTIIDQDKLDSDHIGNYEVSGLLGSGAFASVKSAKEINSSTRYALKVYEKNKMIEKHKKVNVRREVEILKKLFHRNIVKLFRVFEDFRSIYLVMELIEGESLQKFTRNTIGRRLQEEDSRKIFKQILDSVQYIHSLGIVHRDLKLDNILVSKDFKVKLIDFGFATEVLGGKKLNVFCGTPSFMAPEIVSKVEYHGPAADVWALGIILYYVLIGEFPFRGYSEKDLYKKIRTGLFVFPVNISKEAKGLISSLLKINFKERMSTKEVYFLI